MQYFGAGLVRFVPFFHVAVQQFAKLHPDKKQISVGVVGYPNVGKSSIINTLKKKKVRFSPRVGSVTFWSVCVCVCFSPSLVYALSTSLNASKQRTIGFCSVFPRSPGAPKQGGSQPCKIRRSGQSQRPFPMFAWFLCKYVFPLSVNSKIHPPCRLLKLFSQTIHHAVRCPRRHQLIPCLSR